jgi:hypothetical protein
LVHEIFTFFEKHAKNLNAHSEKLGELGFNSAFKRLKGIVKLSLCTPLTHVVGACQSPIHFLT